VVVAVEGYGGVTEPGLRGTAADLRGIVCVCERLGWEGAGIWGRDGGDGGREGVEMGGIFEGFGMNEEGRRALGRGEAKRLPSTGFLELYVYVYVHAPCLYLLSPSRVPVIVSWHWTRPHASFGFRFTSYSMS